MRLAVYVDQAFWREGEKIFSARAFVLFLGRLAESFERVVVLGRLQPQPQSSHYQLPESLEFEPLPGYESSANPLAVARAAVGSMRRFWRILDQVDVVWVLGPHPLSLLFVGLGALRAKRVVLGVRQDIRGYARNRHPGRRWIHVAAFTLEAGYRALSRRYPTVVVGPELARHYRASCELLPITVSLIKSDEVSSLTTALGRSYEHQLQILSVGRLDTEKNPLLLADVLAILRERDQRWRLVVCGDGPMEGQLARRLQMHGVADSAALMGHVPIDGGLLDLYRASNFFLHVSWTEGLPQVLLEAFATGVPVVATAVGGVTDTVAEAALLVPPGDAETAANALTRLNEDVLLRTRLIETGLEHAREHTIEAECARLADFLAGDEELNGQVPAGSEQARQ